MFLEPVPWPGKFLSTPYSNSLSYYRKRHQSEKVFEKYIRVGLSEQAQIVGDKILAAKKAKKKKVDM